MTDATNKKREADKLHAYRAVNAEMVDAGKLVPFALESTGRLGPEAHKFIGGLVKKAHNNNIVHKNIILHNLHNNYNGGEDIVTLKTFIANLGTIIAKFNAKAIIDLTRQAHA